MEDPDGSAVATDTKYPVIRQAALSPLSRRWLRRVRRDATEVGLQPPGTVLVFQHGDRWRQPSSWPLNLGSALVVDATGVVCVSLKRQYVRCHADIPSTAPDVRFVVSVGFECMVTDAVLLMSEGCWDAEEALRLSVLGCPRLLLLGSQRKLSELPDVERRAIAALSTYFKARPPHIAGMSVTFVDVIVGLARTSVTPMSDSDDTYAVLNDEQTREQS